MKYSLVEIVGIYVLTKEAIKFGRAIVKATAEAINMAKVKYYKEEMDSAADRLKALFEEDERRDSLVLDMYREGCSKQEIIDHFGEEWIGKDRVDRICDEEDRSWDAKA